MTALFKTGVLLLTTPECYDQYFLNFNFFHGECLKTTVSKVLGLIIIAGSVTVKVPQIMKVIKTKSGEGISPTGILLDFSAISSFFLYSFMKKYPFSSWGEGLFLAIQTAALLGLILYYKGLLRQLWLFLLGYPILIILILIEIVPHSFLWIMQGLNLPIIILGKGIQVLTNYRNKSTGQLSALTNWMQFLGSTARVFTSMRETSDILIVLSFAVASILNGIIVFQLIYYARSSHFRKDEMKTKPKGKKILYNCCSCGR